MKKLLLLTIFTFLTGCSYFQDSEDNSVQNTNPVEEPRLESVESTESTQEEKTDVAPNSDFNNVFGEEVLGADRYPATSLTDDIPISELRHAISVYYDTNLTTEQKVANHEKIDGDLLNELQIIINEQEDFEDLNVTIDQIQVTFDDKTNYVLRMVVGYPYEEAQTILADNDLALINEALTHIGNRLVMLAYYDQETDTLIPYHLNNSTHSLFSLVE